MYEYHERMCTCVHMCKDLCMCVCRFAMLAIYSSMYCAIRLTVIAWEHLLHCSPHCTIHARPTMPCIRLVVHVLCCSVGDVLAFVGWVLMIFIDSSHGLYLSVLFTPCVLRNRGIAFGCDLSSEPFARLRHFQGFV